MLLLRPQRHDLQLTVANLTAASARIDPCAKYKQIISEGCKLVGEGGAHETDSCPTP
jgi:hypothetical protein